MTRRRTRSSRRRSSGRRRALAALAVAAGLVAANAEAQHEEHEAGASSGSVVLAPGWGELDFPAPEPGTYELPPLGEAADGAVLDEQGRETTLHAVFGDRAVLLSFIYATCPDVNGCPLATAVLQRVQRTLGRDPEIAARLRLVSLSFDPRRDTPDVMKKYGAALADGKLPWRFLTTQSQKALEPILEDYGQAVVVERDADGNELGTFSHVLRVFLIDAQRRIRNVYTVSFLHADTLVADVRTLLREPAPATVADGAPPAVDLVARARRGTLGLPPLPVPADNPLTSEKVALGRKLFFDRRLSLNGTMSCAMCHVPEQGFTNNELATSVGIEGRTVRRNAPTLWNVGYQETLFHDAREDRLEHQIWAPLLAANEMGNPSIGAVLATIRNATDYAGLFEQAFPQRGLALETVGMAIASYERTLVSGDSPFDRWRYGGDESAVSDAAKRGFALFTGKAGCIRCHTVGPRDALFTDGKLHNTGVGYERSMGLRDGPTERIQVAPGEFVDVAREIVESVGDPLPSDLGRYEVTQDPADRWRYRTPTLRNVALTAPYMHDGSLSTLRDVVRFYDRGGVANPGRDPGLRPLGLTNGEVDDLVALLESLTGGDVALLVADARATPIGDPVSSSGRNDAP